MRRVMLLRFAEDGNCAGPAFSGPRMVLISHMRAGSAVVDASIKKNDSNSETPGKVIFRCLLGASPHAVSLDGVDVGRYPRPSRSCYNFIRAGTAFPARLSLYNFVECVGKQSKAKARILKKLFSVMMFLISPHIASAGPFGIDYEGFSLSAYDCKEQRGTFYVCQNIPKPHPDIEKYMVQYADGVGLCMIKGVSRDISDSRYGHNTRSKIDEINEQLQVKYGEGRVIDFLQQGSLWTNPEDWMIGLLKDERGYGYFWILENPIDGVSKMGVFAKALDTETSFFGVEFLNANTDECDKAETLSGASSF